ncbi:MAG: hypothetical protein A3G83_03315 [Betaproteobacteria bacterium RIFCSPLOWO2_12_FULL_68_20]|nr:MAG: hypothetical protein A3G83_03315 [Betaproteobacteria bacterium RIFCSPLOWO2_12_FULL_68_20]
MPARTNSTRLESAQNRRDRQDRSNDPDRFSYPYPQAFATRCRETGLKVNRNLAVVLLPALGGAWRLVRRATV